MKENFPLVSIIITCFKEKFLLKDAVNSALNQTYPNIEIILVKDFSKCHETLKICEEFKTNEKIELVINESQRFTSGSRNVGIKKSSGEFIFCLDGDDYIDDEFISICLKEVSSDKSIDYVYTDMYNVYESHEEVYEKIDFNISKVIARGYPGSGIFYSRIHYDMTNGYNENLIGQEDWEFLVQLSGFDLIGKRIAKPLYHYRRKSINESKHVVSTLKYGIQSRLKIIENNKKTFEKHSIGVIEELFKMKQKLWTSVHNTQNPKHNFVSLLKWMIGPTILGFLKKIRNART